MFGPHVNNGKNVDYALGWSALYNFFLTHDLIPLADAFFNADQDELIKIYIFAKDSGAPARICGKIIAWEAKNS